MPEATLTFPDKNWSAAIYGLASKCLLVGLTGNYHSGANETYLKTDLTPSALFHQTNLTLPPLDPQSWILLIPIVSHVSECSTIRKAFALSRRDDNGAETSTRVAKKEKRAQGETWVLFFRTTRRSDGKRVENEVPIGLVRHLPEENSAWAEVERLHVPINRVDLRRGLIFGDLAQHYAEHELAEAS